MAGVKKEILQASTQTTVPKSGDLIHMHYTGWLYDESKEASNFKGKEFDSSLSRGVFDTKIGVGRVIKGWDEGILGNKEGIEPMKVGEKARLTISPDYAYGKQNVGDGLIPPFSTLIFDVELIGIN